MSLLSLAPNVYGVVAAILVIGYALYRAALPKPIPGIPYHKASANSILGDLPRLLAHQREHHTIMDWMAQQGSELKAPIYQLFLAPFGKPRVFVTDHRENIDILTRRTKEFDRSKFFQDLFVGTLPHNHVVQRTNDKFRASRRLIADTMSTTFLNTVSVLKRTDVDDGLIRPIGSSSTYICICAQSCGLVDYQGSVCG